MASTIGWSASAFVAAVLARLIQKGLLAELDDVATDHLRRLEGLLAPVWRVLDAADAGALDVHRQPFQDLLDAAYAADNALDDYEYLIQAAGDSEQLNNDTEAHRPAAVTRKPRSSLRFLLCFSTPSHAHASSSHRKRSKEKNSVNIDGLRDAFEKVARAAYRCTSMFEHVVAQKKYTTIVSEDPEDATVGVLQDHDIFGREAAVEQILETVRFGDDPHYRLGVGVLPIVGVEGVGKTALAQLIFHHETVRDEFPVRMWAHVSGNLRPRKVIIQMIRSITGDVSDVDEVKRLLMEQLDSKRFLLVLDDVNDVGDAHWSDLMEELKSAARRSLVMVTTQSESVVRAIGTMQTVILDPLASDDYWRMFKQFAFGTDDIEDFTPLGNEWDDVEEEEELSPAEQIAIKIAKKMDGVPMLGKAIGRALYYRQDEDHWNSVLEDELWERGDAGGIPPALWLSYQHLDPRLKQCFGYCAVFPRDYIFQKDELVQMWVAQGLIYSDTAATPEDVGGKFFDELVQRCFFQPIDSTRYLMHTMMLHLAQAVSSNQFFTINDNSEAVPQEVRHLTIRTHNLSKLKRDIGLYASHVSDHFLHRVRTLLFFAEFEDSDEVIEVLVDIFSKLGSVRVLGLSYIGITCLPAEIGLLQHLRYLDFSGNRIADLPEELCRLYFLQVLKLQCPYPYLCPPSGITSLIHLRYLYASEWFLSNIPDIQNLSNLQKLETFRVGGRTHIDALQRMTQLRGTLHIGDLRQVHASEATKGIMKAMQHLNALHFSWGGSEGQSKEFTNDAEVLECLQPHENLKELRIRGYGGIRSPSWMLQTSCCLMNATSLYLTDCMNWKNLPPLHFLPCLEVLEIRKMHAIDKVSIVPQQSDQELFAKLKRLVFEDAPCCTEWADNTKSRNIVFPCLCELVIRDCPKMTTFPDLPLTLTEMTVDNVGLEMLPMMHDKQRSSEEAAATENDSRWTSRLTTLQIHRCSRLRSLGSGLLQQQHLLKSLEKLSIKKCDTAACKLGDGFMELTSLRELSLYDCPKLLVDKFHTSLRILEISECFVMQGAWADDEYPFLFSVWTLKITGCSHVSTDQETKIETLDWLNCLCNVYSLHLEGTSFLTVSMFDKLQSLEIIEIDGCRSFSDDLLDLEWLRKLQFLSIRNCQELTGLPEYFSTLPALEELCVENCPMLAGLPASGLPPSLKRLSISKCSPLLSQKCRDDEHDRANILQIACVYIDGECIHPKQ